MNLTEMSIRYAKKILNEIDWERLTTRGNPLPSGVKREDIYVRDKGICRICGKRVSLKLKHGHKDRAVMDHIIPVAKFGPSETWNIQLACHKCNAWKKDKWPEEYQGSDLERSAEWHLRYINDMRNKAYMDDVAAAMLGVPKDEHELPGQIRLDGSVAE